MFTYLTLALTKLGLMFSADSYQSNLDNYIAGRNPSNAAEVDHYIREFDRTYNRQGGFL